MFSDPLRITKEQWKILTKMWPLVLDQFSDVCSVLLPDYSAQKTSHLLFFWADRPAMQKATFWATVQAKASPELSDLKWESVKQQSGFFFFYFFYFLSVVLFSFQHFCHEGTTLVFKLPATLSDKLSTAWQVSIFCQHQQQMAKYRAEMIWAWGFHGITVLGHLLW